MFYSIACLCIFALAAYGLYALILRFWVSPGERPSVGIHVRHDFSEEDLEGELFLWQQRADRTGGQEPVLLVDCPLREDILLELSTWGAKLYLSYEEYDREKRKRRSKELLDGFRER